MVVRFTRVPVLYEAAINGFITLLLIELLLVANESTGTVTADHEVAKTKLETTVPALPLSRYKPLESQLKLLIRTKTPTSVHPRLHS